MSPADSVSPTTAPATPNAKQESREAAKAKKKAKKQAVWWEMVMSLETADLVVEGDRRFLPGDMLVPGKVLALAKKYAWVRPCGTLPPVLRVHAKLDKEGEPMVYVAVKDVEDGFALSIGARVFLRPYLDPKALVVAKSSLTLR